MCYVNMSYSCYWSEYLLFALLIGCSPFEAFYGRKSHRVINFAPRGSSGPVDDQVLEYEVITVYMYTFLCG